MQGVILL